MAIKVNSNEIETIFLLHMDYGEVSDLYAIKNRRMRSGGEDSIKFTLICSPWL